MPPHFGEFTLDESSRQLSAGSGPVHLSPKAFQLLSILIQERPRAVSRSDLQERLWPDTFVTEGNLAGLVAELRTALGDDAREARFIRTLYGFGYSFLAPVTDVPPTSSEQPPANVSRKRWAAPSIAAVVGAAGIVLILSLRSTTTPTARAAPSIRSIAVLPFDTSGADRADQHLGLGLTDVLITRLSNVRHLVVRPTSAIREFTAQQVDSARAGEQLKVDAVLEGSVRTTADRIRVTVQLFNVREQKPIWADSFDQKRTEMFSIEDDVSKRVAEALMMRLTPNEKSLLAKRYTTDPAAYELFMQGRYEFEQNRREGRLGGSPRTVELFQKAVEKDPSYAMAWALLGQSYFGIGFNHPSRVNFDKAEQAARKALQLDDNLSEAHCAIAAVRMYWYLDYPGAEREFLRALELNPRNTIALTIYAYLLQCLGRFDEALAVREREVEIDPLNPAIQWGLANAYLTSRQDERGIRQCLLVLRMNPNYSEAHIGLARVYTLRGEYDKAIDQARQAVKIGGEHGQRGRAFLGYALGMAGRRSEANEILQQLKKQGAHPFHLAIVDLGLGDREAVFPLLDKGIDDRTYTVRLKTEPIFDPLRSDPRFIALMRRAGFQS